MANVSTTNEQLDSLIQQCQMSKVIIENITAASTALVIAAFVARQATLPGSRFQLLSMSWVSATNLIYAFSDSTLA